MTTAVYCNLDLTLTEMDRPFDAVTVAALERAGLTGPQIDPTEHANLFFDRFLDLEPDPLEGAYEAYFDARDVDPELSPAEAAAVQKEVELDAVSPAVEDLPGLVSTLREAFRVGVLTSGMTDLQRAKLDRLGIADLLDDVAISYELGATKDSGDLFAAAEERLDADRYVYCSTHESDVDAAREAGWDALQIGPADLAGDPVATLRAALDEE